MSGEPWWFEVNTYGLFLLTEHRHGYRGHEEQALGLSVEQLWHTDKCTSAMR